MREKFVIGLDAGTQSSKVVIFDLKGNIVCQGKKDLATKAKQLGYDAIHDTVHEMCKDEARHGMAFKGLLNRYFK